MARSGQPPTRPGPTPRAPPPPSASTSPPPRTPTTTPPAPFPCRGAGPGFGPEPTRRDPSKGTLGALTAGGTDGKVWSAPYTPRPDTESADNTIRVNLAGVQDAQGNAGTGSVSSGNFSIDTRPPGVTVTI